MKKYSEFLNEIASDTAVIQPKNKVSEIEDVLNSIRSFYKNLKSSMAEVDEIISRDAVSVQNKNRMRKSKVSTVGSGTTKTAVAPVTTSGTTLAPVTTSGTTLAPVNQGNNTVNQGNNTVNKGNNTVNQGNKPVNQGNKPVTSSSGGTKVTTKIKS